MDTLVGDTEPGEFDEEEPGAVEARMLYGDDDSPNWSTDRPITSWRAVTVEGGRVVELRWPHPGLRGQIPAGLARLSHLRELWLSSKLTGGIPPELGQLGNLRELWLYGNALSGGIPPELGQLSNLEELRLNSNQLTGSIPAELGKLGKLEYLWLYDNQLTGSIPGELGSLSSLRSLELHENQLSGPIPAEFGRLSNLRELDLHDNQVTGGIPPELAPLQNLSTLDLRDNDLSGSIPEEFAELGNPFSSSVYLSGNGLTGCIPLEMGRALHDRHDLGLSYCQCPATWERSSWGEPEVTFGADGIPYMPHGSTERAGTYRVTFSLVLDLPPGGDFNLGYKRRTDTGRIVVDIDEEKSRSSLTIDPFTGEELGRMVIEGPAGCAPTISGLFDHVVASARTKPLEMPAQPNGLQFIRRLQPVEGPGTYYLGYSDYLVVDVPAGLTLTVDDVSFVCADRCFQWLELRDEPSGSFIRVTGDTGFVRPGDMVKDDSGRDLDALFDSLIASIRRVPPPHEGASCDTPPTSADCATLIEARDELAGDGTLNWSLDTPFWDWDGVRVDPWTGRIVELHLQRENLSGRIPPALGRLTGLEVLNLHGNDLRGGIPPELGELVNLRELNLSWNPLGGEIPPELGALTNLVELFLSTSELTGGIPPDLGRLVNLRELYIGANPLGGEIPPELGALTNLIELSLQDSGLTGGIPPELGRLVNLRELSLGSNPLGGEIPRELGSLSRLMRLYLYSTELVGEIPEELGHLTLLQYLNLYGDNHLEGCIPKGLLRFDIFTSESSNPDLRRCGEDQ
ncbi:MAG: leucine-rich repeat domain-containing protein [Chloroflexi bacterium]|nr:leucine-rich repeat domain-containing protein [Chloroflexota bacterium]